MIIFCKATFGPEGANFSKKFILFSCLFRDPSILFLKLPFESQKCSQKCACLWMGVHVHSIFDNVPFRLHIFSLSPRTLSSLRPQLKPYPRKFGFHPCRTCYLSYSLLNCMSHHPLRKYLYYYNLSMNTRLLFGTFCVFLYF